MPAPHPQPPCETTRTDLRATCQALLAEALDIGMARLRRLHPDAPDAATRSEADAADAYSVLTASIRRSILLADKLAAPPHDPAPNRVVARKRIYRGVEDVIHARETGDRAESLEQELIERLEQPDLEDDLATRPVEDIVADICHDLGLPVPKPLYDWKRRSPQDIRELAKLAAAPPASRSDATPPTRPIPFIVGKHDP